MAHGTSDAYPNYASKLEFMQYLKDLHDSNEAPAIDDIRRFDTTDPGAWGDSGAETTYFVDGDIK